MGTNYIDAYEKQLNERKFALLRTLAGWWIATTKGKGQQEAQAKVLTQIYEMRQYLNQLEMDIEVATPKSELSEEEMS